MSKLKNDLDHLFSIITSEEILNGGVCIRLGTDFLYSRFIGYSDFEEKRFIDESTSFDLASVTKQFTAMAIMQLKEKELLAYSDDIKEYIHEIPYEIITIRNLLNHTSGIPDYTLLFHEKWDKSKVATNKEVLEYLATYKPKMLFKPGEGWEYSNTGYVLLAIIIERISGMSFQKYMKAHIFDVLSMHDSFVVNSLYETKQLSSVAKGYAFDDIHNKVKQAEELEEYKYASYLGCIYGDGGIKSSLTDLLKWDKALDNNTLVKDTTWSEAIIPTVLADGSAVEYGFGWQMVNDDELGKIIFHGGSWPGYSSSLIKYIDKDVSILYMSNCTYGIEIEQSIVKAIENVVFGKPFEMPKKNIAINYLCIAEETLKSYVGVFQMLNEYRVFITLENNNIFMQVEGQNRFMMRAISTEEFIINEVGANIVFKKNNTGIVEKMIIKQLNEQIEVRKID